MKKIFFNLIQTTNFRCLVLTIAFSACESFVEIDPPRNEIVSNTVYSDDAVSISAIKGIYSLMMSQGFASGDGQSLSRLAALSSDEFINYSNDLNVIEFSNNSLQSENAIIKSSLWSLPYQLINNANALIEGLNNSFGVTRVTKEQLLGEAFFIRAFCHFYLVNLFGEIPIITSTDFEVNRLAKRASREVVYAQIIADLKEAQRLLPDDYSFSNNERIQPNRSAATALLARVYLFLEEWVKAEEEATKLIENTAALSLVPDLNKVFLKNSEEAIWQLKPVQPGQNTSEAKTFVIPNPPPVNAALRNELVGAFEPNDSRFNNWVSSVTDGVNVWYYPFKYKVVQNGQPITEYSMVLRLSEQYLIRAEARAHQNKILESQSDLNAIRNRAGLPNTTASDRATLLEAIEHERRIELFTEWGHRWLDLKRTGRIDLILGAVKSDWQSTDASFPIPKTELASAPNLTQNAGY